MVVSAIALVRARVIVIREYFSPKLLFIMFIASLNTFSLGFDLGWWSILIAVPHFGNTFGTQDILLQGIIPWKGLSPLQLSLGAVVPNIGAVLAAPFGAWLAGSFGRRVAMWTCSGITIVATIIEITCSVGGNRYWQLVAGKGIVGLAQGVGGVVIPTYLSEIAPAPIRGAMINAIILNQWLGHFASVAVAYAMRTEFTSRLWIMPIGIQFVMPGILIPLTFLLPESPRWLLDRGRKDDALSSITDLKVRASGWSPEARLAEIEQDIIVSRESPTGKWIDCFRGNDLRRTLIGVGVMAFGAGSGFGFVANYSVLIISSITPKYLEIFIGVLGALVVFVFVGFFTQDMFGRRILLLVGAAIACVCMSTYAIISTVEGPQLSRSTGIGAIFVLMFWLVNYTQTWSAVPWTVFSEIPSQDLREKVIALGTMMSQAITILIVFVSPYIQNAQGGTFQGKIGYIYAGISVAAFLFTYFFVPDLSGCSLEQVDQLFARGVPIRKMGISAFDAELDRASLADRSDEKGMDEQIEVV